MAKQPKKRISEILADPRCNEMQRSFTVDREAKIDKEARTVELSFASEEPVDRWFGREILDMTTESVDLTRLNGSAAFLVNHNWDDQVGVVEKAWVDPVAKKARAVVRFGTGARATEIFNDIAGGIRKLVSVGYVVRKMVLASMDGDVETHRVTDWLPFEVSTVPVPADASVGVGRSKPKEENTPAAPAIQTSRTMNDEEKAKQEAQEARNEAVKAERTRIADINKAADVLVGRHPQHKDALLNLARKCAEATDDVNAFNRSVLADILKTDTNAAPATRQDPNAALLGLDKKDVRRFSLMRAAQLIIANKPLDGLERECHDELTKRLGREAKGFFIPDEIIADRRNQKRTLTVGTPSDGGFTVGQQLLQSEFEEYLRNNTVVAGLGARVIGGLVGDVTIPRQTGGASAYWVSEGGTITPSSATFGQIVSRPRRVGTSVPYSKQFMAQTSLSAESFVISDSDAATAVDIDRVALRGVGGAEPLGIANLASGDRSTSVTFSAAPTWAKYLEFFSSVAANNAVTGSPAYVASVASAVKAMTIPKFSNTATPIWDNGKVGPFRAEWTTQLLTSSTPVANMVIWGDFAQVLFLEWAGRDVVVDPYSGKKEGTVEITIQRLMDVVIRRAKSFACSADSGAQ